MSKKYSGVVVPMITPFTASGDLDEVAVGKMIDHLIDGRVDGVFVLGTTGEKASIPLHMRRRLVRLTVEHVGGRALVYAGTADDCLSHSIEAATESFAVGADAVVVHPPCYYALQPDELLHYFTVLADKVTGPILLYNIPSTTHTSIPIDVIAALSDHPNIAGLKDSENNPARVEGIANRLGGRSGFSLLMGCAVLSTRALALGMDGVVPSSGNLVPKLWRKMMESARNQDWDTARGIQEQVDRVATVFQRNRTLGQSLAALKAAASSLGLCGPDMLPPLRRLAADQIESVRTELQSLLG